MITSTTLVSNYTIEHGDMINDIMYTRSCLRPFHSSCRNHGTIIINSCISDSQHANALCLLISNKHILMFKVWKEAKYLAPLPEEPLEYIYLISLESRIIGLH